MKVKVGIAQMACMADKQQNIERYTAKVRELAAQGAQIVCLQELFASLYFCDEERYQNFQLAEPIPEGATCRHFMALAKELNIVMVCSLFEKRAEKPYLLKFRRCLDKQSIGAYYDAKVRKDLSIRGAAFISRSEELFRQR